MSNTQVYQANLSMLRKMTGSTSAVFHDGQYEAISALVSQRQKMLVVQRTGWGKSAVYFITTCMLRQMGAGPSIIISPLIAEVFNAEFDNLFEFILNSLKKKPDSS